MCPGPALPCLEFHSRSRCTIMFSVRMRWERERESARTLVYPETSFPWLCSCSLLCPSSCLSLPLSFSLCVPSVPCSVVGFCTCHGNIYWHFFQSLFFRGILWPHTLPPAFCFFFGSHTFTPLFIPTYLPPTLLFSSFVFLSVFAKCCQMFAVFPVVYFEAQP